MEVFEIVREKLHILGDTLHDTIVVCFQSLDREE